MSHILPAGPGMGPRAHHYYSHLSSILHFFISSLFFMKIEISNLLRKIMPCAVLAVMDPSCSDPIWLRSGVWGVSERRVSRRVNTNFKQNVEVIIILY